MSILNNWKRIRNELHILNYDTNNYLIMNKTAFCSIELPELYETFLSNREITCYIKGIEGTPFEDGNFKVMIKLPERYPFVPPLFKFITSIYHPNLYSQDYIPIYTLYDWSPGLTIASVLVEIYVLMYNPDTELICESVTDNCIFSKHSIAQVYKNSYEEWKTTAREWTKKYAAPKLWSIFNHKYITSGEHKQFVYLMLRLGYCLANKTGHSQYQAFIDIWVTYIMPHIINNVGYFELKKKHYDYVPRQYIF